jgi:hypothetical protein
MTLTEQELDELERLEKEAFRAPWTYANFEVECDTCNAGEDCGNPECDGSHVPCTQIESPDEYPDGQVVAQFQVPGISTLADRNGALIVALRNAAPSLLSQAREAARLREENARLRLVVETADSSVQVLYMLLRTLDRAMSQEAYNLAQDALRNWHAALAKEPKL